MSEILIIENFGGLKKINIEFNKFNIFIGPQASGKSIVAKLLYFFKSFPKKMYASVENLDTIKKFDESYINTFIEYFPKSCWPSDSFSIEYKVGDEFIMIYKNHLDKLFLKYSDNFKTRYNKYKNIFKSEEKLKKSELIVNNNSSKIKKELILSFHNIDKYFGFNPYFIPAGRSFFANLQSSIFSFLSNNRAIDPFLIEFGSFYENVKMISDRKLYFTNNNGEKIYLHSPEVESIFENILSGKYLKENGTDYIIHNDSRKINVSFASSGQQETLPLLIILKELVNLNIIARGATIFIEEPEAHLYPSAQKQMVELISYVFNNSVNKIQFVITTHSPYILASLNNLMYAGKIKKNCNEEELVQLDELISKNIILDPKNVNAFSLLGGDSQNIICPEDGLISQTSLDDVSNDIAILFDKLLDFE